MTHDNGDHTASTHYLLTGEPPPRSLCAELTKPSAGGVNEAVAASDEPIEDPSGAAPIAFGDDRLAFRSEDDLGIATITVRKVNFKEAPIRKLAHLYKTTESAIRHGHGGGRSDAQDDPERVSDLRN